MKDLEKVREYVKNNNYNYLVNTYESVPDVLSELVRTALILEDGYKFIVADFSSIEARVLSFIANEIWRIVAFKNGKDIYCATASEMFGVPIEKNGVNKELRQKGKQAELACGYGGSLGAMKKMGGDAMGLTDDEMMELVNKWRSANKQIVDTIGSVDDLIEKNEEVIEKIKEYGIKLYQCFISDEYNEVKISSLNIKYGISIPSNQR